jgi:hypothetical protein
MTRKIISVCLVSLAISACSPDNQSGSTKDDNVLGVYVLEQAVEVRHPESGDLIGMRQIRDSIFIEPADDGYKVTNRKWRMNDYEKEGWVSMDHADDRPFPGFVAALEENTLHSEGGHTFTIEQDSHKLLRKGTNRLKYIKVGE